MADPFNMKYAAITPADIFDIYILDFMRLKVTNVPEAVAFIDHRVDEIYVRYLAAAKKRAGWVLERLGFVSTNVETLRDTCSKIAAKFQQYVVEETQGLEDGNLMGAILRAHQRSGANLKGVDTARFGVKAEDNPEKMMLNRMQGAWGDITDAYIALENARSTADKIAAIDHLNDMQHCGGNLLVDFQAGHRVGEGRGAIHNSNASQSQNVQEAIDNLKIVLDIKAGAKHPSDFIDKTSPEVRKFWLQNKVFVS